MLRRENRLKCERLPNLCWDWFRSMLLHEMPTPVWIGEVREKKTMKIEWSHSAARRLIKNLAEISQPHIKWKKKNDEDIIRQEDFYHRWLNYFGQSMLGNGKRISNTGARAYCDRVIELKHQERTVYHSTNKKNSILISRRFKAAQRNW